MISTDETLDIVAAKVEEYKAKGFQIEQVTREIRQGYKAGALRDAMVHAKGEFMAIFDADFIPRTDFLLQTIPYFNDKRDWCCTNAMGTHQRRLFFDYSSTGFSAQRTLYGRAGWSYEW